ncbi:hypothetical protein [Macrococcoides bohemicum]|uniref:hypothetical protein n=1 Tax=Macrococcoides bohemicum TaxID=1903056 RepID=UPI00165D949F|nr:hypothetical protein [Macrococcus bohemicus]MBC9875601.1 hypothetical protein [Macrococcus bohemicus]
MGLDMYIVKGIEEYEDLSIIEEYAYFRKFNALHGYFDQKYNLENPGKVQLDNETVRDLYHRLNSIAVNPALAQKMLPVYYGPFFGSYEYGEIYHYHIKEGLEVFRRLKEIDMSKDIHYYMADY